MKTHTVATLLAIAAVFQLVAWYYHLKHPEWVYLFAVVVSLMWAIPEYFIITKANTSGKESGMSLCSLRLLALIISIVVFIPFAKIAFGEKLTTERLIALGLVAVAGWLTFK